MTMPIEGLGQDTSVETSQNDGGINPSWNSVLEKIPQDLHSQVLPQLREWDQNFQKVQQEYSPYQEFAKNNVTPDQIRQAMTVSQALETNPQGVYDVLRQHFGDDVAAEMVQEVQTGPSESWRDNVPPEFLGEVDRLKQGYETMAQIMLSKQEQEKQTQEDAQLDALYNWMETTSPVFKELNKNKGAEPYVNALLASGMKPEDALKQFHEFADNVGVYHNRPKPPMVFGGNGRFVASTGGPDIKTATDKQVRNLIAQQLTAVRDANQ